MKDLLRDYFPFIVGLGTFGLIALILIVDLFVYPILNDPDKKD